MRTRSQSRNNSPQQEASPVIVEHLRIELPFLEDHFQEDPSPEVPMADNRTMAELLQAPTEGYEDAIIIPEIAANNFELVAKVSTSSSTPAISSEVAELKDMISALLLDKKNQSSDPTQSPTPSPVKAVEPNCATYGGAHSYQNCPATNRNVYRDNIQEYVSQAATANYNQGNTSFRPQMVANQIRPPDFSPIQTHQNNQNNFNRGNNFNQNRGVSEPVVAPVSVPIPNLKSSIPYPSRRDNERRRDQANEQIEKFYEIFKDMSFEISFTDALILMPKFASTLKTLIGNKEKLSEMARTSMNEHCSAIILNKLPRKLRDPALSLSELTPTCTTLKLAECSVSKPIGIIKDVSFKVGVFHFPADFMVIDFEPDPRVPLIPGRCFLKTGRALIDVHKGEITLRIGNKAITYNLDQTVRYSANYNQMTANKIDVIDMACELYSQEVLGFSAITASGNPTPHDDPIVSTTSPTLTPFGDSDFLLFEEADAFLGLEDDPNSPKINPFYYDPEADILLLEAILNTKTVKSSVDEPPEVELKDLPHHLEYAFLEGDNKLPGINPEFCTHKLLMEEDYKPAVQHQRRVNPKIYDVIKKEVEKLLDAGLIYPISDSPWVSPVHCVPKKGGFTVVENKENKLIPTRLVTGWRVCIDYRKLNEATRKDHFPLPFMNQMLERLAGNEYYCFPDGFSRCMLAIFHDMVGKKMEVFMDEFSVFRNSFENCLSRLDKMLQRCEDTNLCLNWEKSYFMVKEGIVLSYKISKNEIEVDKAKVDVIAKLPHPITVKSIRSFLGHASFYQRFIQDFSKFSRPMTHLLEKNTLFIFFEDCIKAFQMLKKKLTEAPILITLNWDLPFELMCDASDFAIGAVLGQRHEKHFRPIHYASKTMTDAESNYTTTKKEMLAVVYPFEKFRSYLIMNKSIVHMDHSALRYLFAKKDAKARLIRCVLLLQEFDFKVLDMKGAENLAADHLFGAPRAIISARGTHFCNDQFAKVMLKHGVTHCLSIAYHPQTSRQVEVSNRGLKRILERTIGENRASWSDKLDDALWAFRTAYKTPIGCTPYRIVYEKACHLSNELEHKAYWALKQVNFNLAVAGDPRKVQLNELNELHDHAYENSLIYKEKTKRIHDSKIKNRFFNVGDRVLLFNSRLKIFSGKLKTRWSGPFTITKVFPYVTVELSQSNGPNFKVNGHRVKNYFGGDVPQLDCPDCKVSRALSFCRSFTRASYPQLHFGNPVSKSYRLTFSFGILHKWP
nr:DNA-directed DNA polymerase [Tanacetum cinerariifolium]